MKLIVTTSLNFFKLNLEINCYYIFKFLKLNLAELDELEFLLTRNTIFINEALLPEKIVIASEKILAGVDLNDAPFVALAKHLKAKLWTGDKALTSGLQNKNFIDILTTKELSDLACLTQLQDYLLCTASSHSSCLSI